MHRLVLLVFGFNIVSFGMCTMAHAQMNEVPMERSMVCRVVKEQARSASICNGARGQQTSHLEGSCAGSSCFVRNMAGERVTLSSDPGLVKVSSLPPQLGQPMLLADEFQIPGQAEFGRAPPGQFTDVVLRL